MVAATAAGVAFALLLVWLFEPLIWFEGTLAQALLSGNPGLVHFYYKIIVPLIDGTVCGLLVGFPFGLIRMPSRWLHVVAFFLAFYATHLGISSVYLFAQLFVIAPFMWLFPLMTCLFILVLANRKRRTASGT